MGSNVLYAIAESCPFDALLVRDMKRTVNLLLQLNLRRFRVPQKNLAKYSALDILKQALELLFEFSPSKKNYREAIRTLQVYSEGDPETLATLNASFKTIANAVYSAYSAQRHVESIAPETLFLQGIPFELNELQQSFRFVGVRPPDISPSTVKKTIFLDEGFERFKAVLEGKTTEREAEKGREEHWAKIIQNYLAMETGTALIRAGARHLDPPRMPVGTILSRLGVARVGKLPRLLLKSRVELRVIYRVADVNRVFGK
jgi:hypothetical protein